MKAIINENGSVTVSGTNTEDAFNLLSSIIYLPKDEYYVTNNLKGIDLLPCYNGVGMYVWSPDMGTVSTVPDLELKTNDTYQYGVRIESGASVDNYILYPMIRLRGGKEYNYSPVGKTKIRFS